jgi:pyridoxine kinase
VLELQSRMRAAGPRIVLVTSVRNDETPEDMIELLASSPQESFLLRTPILALSANGAGDLIAALFLFHILNQAGLQGALENAASATWGVLAHTQRAGSRELCLIPAQQELVSPGRKFRAISTEVLYA